MAEKITQRRPVKRATRKATKAGKSAEAAGGKDSPAPLVATAEVHSVEARASVRDQIADDIERFLDAGGSVVEVPKDFRADPPRRPENNYGRGSI